MYKKREGKISPCLTGKARLADTFIAVYAIFADSVVTRVASTVVKVDFTVITCVRSKNLFNMKANVTNAVELLIHHPSPEVPC